MGRAGSVAGGLVEMRTHALKPTTLGYRIAVAALMVVAACGIAVLASAPAAQAGPICGSPPCAIELSYFKPPASQYSSYSKTLCTLDTGGHCIDIDLKGWLYLPGGRSIAASEAGLPLLVFIHGSSHGPVNPATEMARYFTGHGYAFFVLHRRGHGDSTGTNLDFPTCTGCTPTQAHLQELGYQQKQTFEVKQAIKDMLTLKNSAAAKLIDPAQVAFMGHSYGGDITLFSDELDLGQQTAVSIAAASESWNAYDNEDGSINDSSLSITTLKNAVAGHLQPLMFLEPTNDCSTRPLVVLSNVIGDQNEPYEATLFGRVPNVTACQDAHVGFVTQHSEVYIWGPSVKAWLQREGVG